MRRNGSLHFIPSPSCFISSYFHFAAECCSCQQKGTPLLIALLMRLIITIFFVTLISSIMGFWIFLFNYSATLYTWEHILMVQPLPLLSLKLPHLLTMIYWVQSWEGIYEMRENHYIKLSFLSYLI